MEHQALIQDLAAASGVPEADARHFIQHVMEIVNEEGLGVEQAVLKALMAYRILAREVLSESGSAALVDVIFEKLAS